VDGTAASVRRILEALAGFVGKWRVPTQCCVLAHVTAQIEAARRGAPADLIFQSIAGSQKGNEAFGFSAAALDEAAGLLREKTLVPGPNRLYFETGQGSELSSGAHHGADQVVMEARCYGFARHWRPFLVNTVVGFIGPEYLYDAAQVTRAGLEDHFMGKLSGLPMGCDACYTNHIKADQNDLENLAALLALAGCNYVMGVPLGDDVMLNYQTTSFHDGHTLRLLTGRRAVPEFHDWLTGMGIINPDGRPGPRFGDASVFLGPGY
jgi:ethanolamine ammonia-lyase large subunit